MRVLRAELNNFRCEYAESTCVRKLAPGGVWRGVPGVQERPCLRDRPQWLRAHHHEEQAGSLRASQPCSRQTRHWQLSGRIIVSQFSPLQLTNHNIQVLVVCPQALSRKDKFLSLCSKLRLSLSGSLSLSPSLLSSCLSYSLSARLAPHWNRVGSWLLKEHHDIILTQSEVNSYSV